MWTQAYHALFARKAEAAKKLKEKEAAKRGGRGGARGGRGAARGGRGGRGGGGKALVGAALSQRIKDCLRMIQKDDQFPTIVFSFSRKECMTFGRRKSLVSLSCRRVVARSYDE